MSSDRPASAETPWAAPWERRRHQRISVKLPARLHGPWGEIACETENVSASGTLLAFDRSLAVQGSLRDRSPRLAVARMAFGSHLEAVFVNRGVAMQSRLARAVLPPDESWKLFLGLKFEKPLGPLHLQRLGLPTLLATPLEVPLSVLKEPPAPPGALNVRVRIEGQPASSCTTGRLWGVEDHLLTVRLPRADAGECVASLGGCALSVEVEEGADPIWSARAHLLSVRIAEGFGAVEIQFLANRDPRAALGPRLTATAAT